MPLRLLPDAEWAATRWLRDHAEVPYDVGTSLDPDKDTWPFVTVARIGGTPDTDAHPAPHIDRARVDFDVWAVDRTAAVDAARTVHAAMHEAKGERVSGDSLTAVVSNVTDALGFTWVSDPDPAVWHGVFSLIVTTHPTTS